jgi:maltose alpha-D-glucosyltransferase/alpha-amylase
VTGSLPELHVEGGSVAGALDPAVLRALEPADLARWLMTRRWFGAKGTPPADARITEVVPLHWGGDRAVVTRIIATDAAGVSRGYQLPLVAREGDPADERAAAAALARIEARGARGTLLDALEDGGFRAQLGAALGIGASFEGDGARWSVEPVGIPTLGLGTLETEVSRAEQSNTSVRYGDRAMLKLFRRLEHGENPDVEIGMFLTTRTSFQNTPSVLGVIRYCDATGATYVTGMLSRFVEGARDGWAIALDAARAAVNPARADAPGDFAREAERVGAVTRDLHAALESAPDTPGFRTDPVSLGDAAHWADAARRAMDAALTLLGERADALPKAHQAMARAIAGRRAATLDLVDDAAAGVRESIESAPPGAMRKIRHHGDYHLGQLLRGEKGVWFIVDFEGEPSRPLADRRALSTPARDVAGMLRSFAYAASTAAAERGALGVDAGTEIAAAHWERDVRAAFLTGYGVAADDPLVALFEMEKLFYELSYELNNRPEWVWIPLRGIARLF